MSGFAFESPGEALAAMVARVEPVGTERVRLPKAGGRVLAEGVVADRPSPSCDVSAMDGYALRLADANPGRIEVAGEILIGRAPPEMVAGRALKIVTGAPVPAGADVVIKREDVEEHGDHIILGDVDVKPNQNIRRRGENLGEGDGVASAGGVITPTVVGALATFGVVQPLVHERVRVGVLSTGDEVLRYDESPGAYQLRDSNAPGLAALLSRHAWIDVLEPGHVPDDKDETVARIGAMLDRCDALMLMGGVSMGDRDFVPAALEANGVETVFHKLPQRPGKPVLGGVVDGRPVFGLPGNPVSVLATARALGLPALAVRAGITRWPAPPVVRVVNADDTTLGLWWRRLVRLVGVGEVELVETRGSGDVPSSARSDGFVELPPGASGEGPWAYYGW
jgi:molybdopterin molybdotransferase